MPAITALIAGLIFGVGLIMSGMTNPAKVRAFLDIGGTWDPSLVLVMGGAIGVGSIAFLVAKRRRVSFLGLPIQLPVSTTITLRLALGSAAFGVGWGLAGFCPGPALVALGAGYAKAFGFVAAMVAGMLAHEALSE